MVDKLYGSSLLENQKKKVFCYLIDRFMIGNFWFAIFFYRTILESKKKPSLVPWFSFGFFFFSSLLLLNGMVCNTQLFMFCFYSNLSASVNNCYKSESFFLSFNSLSECCIEIIIDSPFHCY